MKEIKNGEQPKTEADSSSVETENVKEEILTSSKQEEKEENITLDAGSLNLKKFKTVKDLEEAYENLEAEFTKKSQKLRELEKENAAKPELHEKTEDELLEFVKTNKELKSSFLKDYFESLTKNAPPIVISGKGSGFSPAKEKQVLDFNDAVEAVKKIFE